MRFLKIELQPKGYIQTRGGEIQPFQSANEFKCANFKLPVFPALDQKIKGNGF